MKPPGHNIPDHVAAFGRTLRRMGLPVGSQQVLDGVIAVSLVDLGCRDDFREALATVFVVCRSDREVFDLAFDAFWSSQTEGTGFPGLPTPPATKLLARVQRALGMQAKDGQMRPQGHRHTEATLTYSTIEALRDKDFAAMTEPELKAAAGMLRQWACGVESMQVRRMRMARGGRKLHLSSTLRRSLQQGAEVFTFGTQERKIRPRPMVVLCDISGSMDRYCRMLLHFMHTITQGFQRVEGFAFGTRLTRITRCLRERDADAAVGCIAREVQDWGGGTRTGDALREFNVVWLRRVLRSSGIVMIISDGIDRGDPVKLGVEMARLRRSCHRLIWLSPLLGYSEYQPLTRGMRAALPHVSDFLPVHSLNALADLSVALRGLGRLRVPQHSRMFGVPTATD